MAMEFGRLSKMSVGEVVTGVATEGGAVVAGLLGSGIVGKQVEKFVKPGVVPTSTITDKLIAYAGNNLPKLAVYYLLRKEGGKYLGGYEKDMGKGALSSVVLDTIVRAGNGGAPKSLLVIGGFDVLGGEVIGDSAVQQETMQKVLQENSSLRSQLNSALNKLASAPNVNVSFPPDHDRQYGMMQSTPEAENRRKNFGAMTPPIEAERNRQFGAMNKAKLNFAGESDSVASMFGML